MSLAAITNVSLIADLVFGAWTNRPQQVKQEQVPEEPKPTDVDVQLTNELGILKTETRSLEHKLALTEKTTKRQESDRKVLCKKLVLEKQRNQMLQKELNSCEKKVDASLQEIEKTKKEFAVAIEQEKNTFETFLEAFKKSVTADAEAIIESSEKEAQIMKNELEELRMTVEKMKIENMFLNNIVQAKDEILMNENMKWSRQLSEAAFYLTENDIFNGNAFNYYGNQVWDKSVFL